MEPRALLDGARIAALHRHGKQLAIEANDGRVLVIQLGMSGQIRLVGPGYPPAPTAHRHIEWRLVLDQGRVPARCRVLLCDPRRFGGVHAARTMTELRAGAWGGLGPDALDLHARALAGVLVGRRAVKAVLLDQGAIAGVGNIYADEALFRARVHPATRAERVPPGRIAPLAAALRAVLRAAVAAGGSSLRDYMAADGACGAAQNRHAVYGAAGSPCLRCRTTLRGVRLAGRATVFCPACQPKA